MIVRVCAEAARTGAVGRGSTFDGGAFGGDFLGRDSLGSPTRFSENTASRKTMKANEIDTLRRVTSDLGEDIFNLRV
jgi:hypothetical protein